MTELKNSLNWSFSRKRMFESCRRKYYYNYYLKWGGWNSSATGERRVAYRLSKMTSILMLAGDIVHQGIDRLLIRFRNNRLVLSESEVLSFAKTKWDKAIADSKSLGWRTDPKNFTCLIEDYYGDPRAEESKDAAWDRITVSLKNFLASGVWQSLQKSRPQRWLALGSDDYAAAEVDGVPLFAKPDLGYDASKAGEPKSVCRVFDWKSGKPNEADLYQVRLYALYVSSLWGFSAEAVKAKVVYLCPHLIERPLEIDRKGLDDALTGMKASFQEMKSVLIDPVENIPMDISCFPVTARANLCGGCPFQEICSDRPVNEQPHSPELGDDYDPFE